jgi:hypothetical protein
MNAKALIMGVLFTFAAGLSTAGPVFTDAETEGVHFMGTRVHRARESLIQIQKVLQRHRRAKDSFATRIQLEDAVEALNRVTETEDALVAKLQDYVPYVNRRLDGDQKSEGVEEIIRARGILANDRSTEAKQEIKAFLARHNPDAPEIAMTTKDDLGLLVERLQNQRNSLADVVRGLLQAGGNPIMEAFLREDFERITSRIDVLELDLLDRLGDYSWEVSRLAESPVKRERQRGISRARDVLNLNVVKWNGLELHRNQLEQYVITRREGSDITLMRERLAERSSSTSGAKACDVLFQQ